MEDYVCTCIYIHANLHKDICIYIYVFMYHSNESERPRSFLSTTTILRRQRSGTFTWCPARRCSLRTQILEFGPTHPACAVGGAQPPFSKTGAAHPTLHLRLLLPRAGLVEVNPGPVCSGCTDTIRVGSHPIICTQCQRLFHGYCNGLTRDKQMSPQGYVFDACGCTNGSTIQPSQITRSQSNDTLFR